MPENVPNISELEENRSQNGRECLIKNGVCVLLAGIAITGGGIYAYSTGNESIGSAMVMLGLFTFTFGCFGTREKVCRLTESHSERVTNEVEMGYVDRIRSGIDARQNSVV